MTPPRLAFVGTGPVARALAAAYVGAGGDVVAVVSRSAAWAADVARRVGARRGSDRLADALAADLVVVAVAERGLPEVAARMAAAGTGAGVVVHTSGALAGDALGSGLPRKGSLHPLQSFPDALADAELAARVAGTHWFHEGDGADVCAAAVRAWRGTFHRLAPGAKALYHAGAATMSNHAVALFDAASRLFEAAGVPQDEARAPLAALLAGTAANLAVAGVPAALTGPIARGDAETVRRHLEAVGAVVPELLESYRAMARRALVVARAKGLSAESAAALDELLS